MLSERTQTQKRPCTALSSVYEVSVKRKTVHTENRSEVAKGRDADRGFTEKGQEKTSVMKMVLVVIVIYS